MFTKPLLQLILLQFASLIEELVRCGRHIWVVPFPADLPDERLTAGGGERLILGAADDGHLALVLGPANLLLWHGSELVFADKLDHGHPEYRSLPNGVKSFPYRVLE